MPFQSRSQIRSCFAKDDPNWDCHAWAHETPSIKRLPERKAEGGPLARYAQGGPVSPLNVLNRQGRVKTGRDARVPMPLTSPVVSKFDTVKHQKAPEVPRYAQGGAVRKYEPIDPLKPLVHNADGSISTERTITITRDGVHHVIPTIMFGKQVEPKVAEMLFDIGAVKPLGSFSDLNESEDYATRRSQEIGKSRGMGLGYAKGGSVNWPDLEPEFARIEQEHGLPSGLLKAVATTESGGNPRAVSPKGAQGLFQFMPQTAKRFGLTDPFEPVASANAAGRYLKALMSQFNDIGHALAGYNWGEGNASKIVKGILPKETQNYVAKVKSLLGTPAVRTTAAAQPVPGAPVADAAPTENVAADEGLSDEDRVLVSQLLQQLMGEDTEEEVA